MPLCLSARTLRSQTPQGVEQELYGLLLAYFAVRALRYAAALQADWDQDAVSFVHTINVLQRRHWRLMQASGWQRPALRQGLLQEVRQERVPPRRDSGGRKPAVISTRSPQAGVRGWSVMDNPWRGRSVIKGSGSARVPETRRRV